MAIEKKAANAITVKAPDEPWQTKLMTDRKGNMDDRSPLNAFLFMCHHEQVSGCLAFDEFSDKMLVIKPLPWEPYQNFRVRRINDNDAFMSTLWLERLGIKMNKQTMISALEAAAKEQTTNPAKEYFNKLEWDGVPRLDKWLAYYLGAENQPAEYLAAVGKKWMTAIVSRSYRPGSKFDHMLILEGSQGIGKSTALRELATFGGETFFYDGKVSFTDKDTLIALQGKIIIEMAEMASYKKAINEEIKSFISRQTDDYRPVHARYMTDRPRYFVLTGSTNEKEYLIPDESGHRRYWPVECGNIDIESLQSDREQLWAEAVRLYKTNFATWVLPNEISIFTEQQEKRVMKDAWFDLVRKKLDSTDYSLTIDDIFDHLEIKPGLRGNLERSRIKSVLIQNGWFETRDSGRVWKRKPQKETLRLSDDK